MVKPESTLAITGVGLVTSLGWGLECTFDKLIQGHSGIRSGVWNLGHHGLLPWAGYPVCLDQMSPDSDWDDPVFPILEFAASEAINRSGLDWSTIPPSRRSAVISLSKGPVRLQSRFAARIENLNQRNLSKFISDPDWRMLSPSAGSTFLAQRFGIEGPVSSPVTACASGLTAIRHAASLLINGQVDVALAGAADASLEPFIHGAFLRMKSLAGPRFADEPEKNWIRPWAASRNGFLIGEGGAVFVIERLQDVRRSGRMPMALIHHSEAGAEAHHPTRPHSNSEVLTSIIRKTASHLSRTTEIDAVHLHATATRGYDPLEAKAVMNAMGKASENVLVTASKAQIGHCLGAAGAVELAICCQSIKTGCIPPFETADSGDFPRFGRLPGTNPMQIPIRNILKIVAGFGGHIEVCLLGCPL